LRKSAFAIAVLVFLACSTAAADTVVYDNDNNLLYRIRNDTVFDRDGNKVGYLRGSRIYDLDKNPLYRVKGSRLYDDRATPWGKNARRPLTANGEKENTD